MSHVFPFNKNTIEFESSEGISGFFRDQHMELLCGFTALWAHWYENVYTLQYSHAVI